MATLSIGLHPFCFRSGQAGVGRTLNHGTNFTVASIDLDAASDENANMIFPVPFAESGATSLSARNIWRATATSGAAFLGGGADGDVNSTTLGIGLHRPTDTAAGTTLFSNTVSFTPNAAESDPTADRLEFFQIGRDADNASDNMTGDAQVIGVFGAMTSSSALGIQEKIITGKTFDVSAGGCSLTTAIDSPNDVDAVSFPNGGGYCQAVFTLPYSFTGNLKITTWVNPGDTGTTVWRHDLAYVAKGETFDTAVTTGSSFTITGGASTGMYQDKQRAAVSGAAAGDTVHLRVVRTSGGTSTAAAKLIAIQISYDIGTNATQSDVSPCSFAVPSSNPASVVSKVDTNNNYCVGRFASGSTTNLHNQCQLSSQYLAGGVLRIRWISSGTGSAAWKALYAFTSGETGESTDPSPTDPGTVTTISHGAGKLNETSFSMPGAAARDTVLLKIQRQSSDTIGANVEIVDAWWEYIPA